MTEGKKAMTDIKNAIIEKQRLGIREGRWAVMM
jgi:hypothetical protein